MVEQQGGLVSRDPAFYETCRKLHHHDPALGAEEALPPARPGQREWEGARAEYKEDPKLRLDAAGIGVGEL
jgi:hypothetical protein